MGRKIRGAHRLETDERMDIELSGDRDDELRGVMYASQCKKKRMHAP